MTAQQVKHVEILMANAKTAVSHSKNLCEISRGLRNESKALIQTARPYMMDRKIAESSHSRNRAVLVFPSEKPLKQAA
jgi:hypothetical protein